MGRLVPRFYGARRFLGFFPWLLSAMLGFSMIFLMTKVQEQVKLQIANNAFFIVQRATAQSKTGIFREYGVAEAPPGFQVLV
jgi:hypothetical protein